MNFQRSIGSICLIAALSFVSLLSGYAQAEITVVFYDGSESRFSIAENGSLSFEEDNLVLDEGIGNTPHSFEITSIEKLLLEEKEITNAEIIADEGFAIYPNPCRNKLFIRSANADDAVVEIYSLTGRLLLKQALSEGQVAVEMLEAGVYLLKVDGQTHKFVKL